MESARREAGRKGSYQLNEGPNSWTTLEGRGDLEQPVGMALMEAFDEINGQGAYARYLDDLSENIARIDEDIIELLPEVSSK